MAIQTVGSRHRRVHAFALTFAGVSLLTIPTPLERLQGAEFVGVPGLNSGGRNWAADTAGAEELLAMSQRIVGSDQAQNLFRDEAVSQGKDGYLPDPTPSFLETLERQLAGSVGAATSHAMIAQVMGGARVTVDDLIAMADETAQIMEHSSQLETKSHELTRTARQLREANSKLTELSAQKDAFLSQISHELRTPMTSIRSFSEILRDMSDLNPEAQTRYASIIHDEALRLTRLLDDLLDLSVLENGRVDMNIASVDLQEVLDQVTMSSGMSTRGAIQVDGIGTSNPPAVLADADRLAQVFLNLVSNAQKYCNSDDPRLIIKLVTRDEHIDVDFIDNGDGIPARSQDVIFEKFSRLSDDSRAGGAGLGLAICREIMVNMGGSIRYLPGQNGAAFRVCVPLAHSDAAQGV